jgi:hypothetical protein
MAVVRCAMYQTAAAMSAMITMHNMSSITNRCTASRDEIDFHSSMFGSPTAVLAGDCTEI